MNLEDESRKLARKIQIAECVDSIDAGVYRIDITINGREKKEYSFGITDFKRFVAVFQGADHPPLDILRTAYELTKKMIRRSHES